MKKTIMMLATMAFVFGMASCSDDDDNNGGEQVVDIAGNVVGTFTGATVANNTNNYFSNLASNRGNADSITITKADVNLANITYKSSTWGTVTFSNVVVSENDSAYVFSQANDSIAMAGHGGSVSNYGATLSNSYMLKNGTSKLHLEITANVMGSTRLDFIQNDLGQMVAGSYTGTTLANSAYFTNFGTEGQVDTLTVTKTSLTTADITFKSGTWGTANFTGSTISENDSAYVFSEVNDSIAMPRHVGTVGNYAATFNGYVLKKGGSSKLKVTVNAPAVMGGTIMSFTSNN